MKKYLAIILSALMIVSMAAVAFAVDNVFEYNFEDDDEGDFIAIDNSIKFYPKQGSVEVVKFDGTMCIKIDQTGYEDISGSMDNYVDFVAGGASTWGVEKKYVLSYDVYFETIEEGASWQICCSRETPAGAGTQFQQVGYFKGDKTITATGKEEPVATFETGKWIHVDVAVDKENKVMSLYIDHVCLAKDIDYTVTDNSAEESERVRSGFGNITAGANALAYLDNIEIYNATEPRNVKAAAPETTAAPVTEAPVTTAAPTTTAAPVTQAAPATTTTPAKTADVAVVIAAIAAIAASGAIVIKKKH